MRFIGALITSCSSDGCSGAGANGLGRVVDEKSIKGDGGRLSSGIAGVPAGKSGR